MTESSKPTGPDLAAGVSIHDIPEDGILAGHVGEDPVLLIRQGDGIFATGASCTHYHGPLAKGLVVGETIRCPWHHACFSLRNGEALAAPALNPIACWRVERQGETVYVRDKLPAPKRSQRPQPHAASEPDSIVIIGGGAAGEAAAVMLRFCGYERPVTVISAENNLPCDRPNLSKDYLAGAAPEAWVPLRSEEFYREHDISLQLNTSATRLNPARRQVQLTDGGPLEYGGLLLATGAEPVKPSIPGAELPHVHYLRTLDDSRAIIAAVEQGAERAVVLGASFIGLEVAASLRQRGVKVDVVAPQAGPLGRVFGPTLSDFIRGLHEANGVTFHMSQAVMGITRGQVTLADSSQLAADIVIAGTGVRPRIELAERAGLELDGGGVRVDEYLETSVPGVYAAGDIACWPDALTGEPIRAEHWVVAQRQGQVAARNLLGYRERYTSPPFFWSRHYDVSLNCVGHAEQWDDIRIDGDPEKQDCAVSYRSDGRTLALVTIFRDRQSLEMEASLQLQAVS